MPSSSSNGGEDEDGPRYAPEDPTLPHPWRGLVDGSTGYLYYWNPVTNVTQYEKPVKEKKRLPGPPPLPPPPSKKPVSSSVHVSSRNRGHEVDGADAGNYSDQHGSQSRRDLHQGGRLSSSHSVLSSGDVGRGHGSKTSSRGHASSVAEASLSAEAYRRQHEITITGDDIPPPYATFESTGFSSEILKEVHRAGFSVPTPIQAQSWPIALNNRDVVAIAKTGSGKTLGYLIPGFIHLKRLQNNPRAGPTMLVLAPTRELATQIQDEAQKFGRSSRISCTCVYGGAPKGPQLRDLDRGVDVVVATPGRLNDILEMRRISLRQVSYLVLDEADRMLDMGFEPQIRKIVKEIPNRRQTLMFTATWPKEVRKIAADLLVRPVQVNIGSIDKLVANKAITQYVEVIKPNEKQRRLEQILRSQEPGSKVLVFCSTKKMCDQLARALTRHFGASAIHGDKNQSERDRVLNHFRTGRSPILVATDVAARGLDIKDIRVVINYDFPTGVEDYVHRIGRTGRAGATGVSYTFFCDQDSKFALDLVKVLEGAGQEVPPELHDMVVSRGGYGGRSRRWGSGIRDSGRINGGGRTNSSLGRRDGRALPLSSGRSAGDLDGHGGHSDHNLHDRYDRDHNHQPGHEAATRGRQDPKIISRGRVRSRSSSHGHGLSPSPKRRRVGLARSSTRSPSPNLGHPQRQRQRQRQRQSRKRSRSTSRDFEKYGGSKIARKQSPLPRREPSANHSGDHHSRSLQQQRSSPRSYDDGEIRDDEIQDDRVDRSPDPRKDISRAPYPEDDRVQVSPSPYKERSLSPYRSPSPYKERSRSPYTRDDRVDRFSSPQKERSQSPNTNSRRLARSASPKQRHRSPNYINGADRPVQQQPVPRDEEEEEEGMIHPEEEEGMIHPEESMVSDNLI